jgi:hypothetical protein
MGTPRNGIRKLQLRLDALVSSTPFRHLASAKPLVSSELIGRISAVQSSMGGTWPSPLLGRVLNMKVIDT